MCTTLLNPSYYTLVKMLKTPTIDADQVLGDGLNVSSFVNGTTCQNALTSISYQIIYTIDENGLFKIVTYSVKHTVANVTLNGEFNFKSTVWFTLLSTSSSNTTSIIRSWSGNPGYIEGYPLILQIGGVPNYYPLDVSNSNGICYSTADFTSNTSIKTQVIKFGQSNIDYCD